MRIVPSSMTQAWLDSAKVGSKKATVRATVQIQKLRPFPYDTAWMTGGSLSNSTDHHAGTYTSMIFGDLHYAREIRHIQSCEWERSTDQDVASCTLTLKNAEVAPIGNAELLATTPGDFEQPGYFTYNRGDSTISTNRWGYTKDDGWNGMFVPDRLIRTYEGYGADYTVDACDDPNLVQTGTWLIDSVEYTHEGSIVLHMRDLGRLLLDQICFPPVVPWAQYPLSWVKVQSRYVKGRAPHGGDWLSNLKRYGRATSSNRLYIGAGLTDPPYPSYVEPDGGWNGHEESDALVTGDKEQWVSTGQDSRDSYVWWEYDLNSPKALAAIRLKCKRGPYRVYVSVHNGTKWLGTKRIPYEVTTAGIDLGADIKYMKSTIADRMTSEAAAQDIVLPRVVKTAHKIRITLTRLSNNGVGTRPWRGAIQDVKIYTGKYSKLSISRGNVLKVVGNYADYTDIIQIACAWGGFYWPPHSSGADFIRRRTYPGAVDTVTPALSSLQLTDGRVWGETQATYTAGLADLTVDQFDKKPLMDMINYVRDLTGFRFFIDELGRVVWRQANLWSLGNYQTGQSVTSYNGPTNGGHVVLSRTSTIITLDERDTLLEYSTQLSSENIREQIFVANVTGKIGSLILGFNPYPVGMRRITGWTDQRFGSKSETRVMADFIAAQQMFSWKKGQATIPGYPRIQVDDQIRIYERVTNETYYHHVVGITSSLDMDSGEYTYKLNTHWLGENPSDAWAVKVTELSSLTRQYLNTLNYGVTNY